MANLGELQLGYLPFHEKYKTSNFLNLHKKYRSHIEIMALIIEVSKGRDTPQSSIMRYANVNHKQLKKYLKSLSSMGFIEANPAADQVLYRATEKGLAYLRQYYVLLGMLVNVHAQSQLAQIVR